MALIPFARSEPNADNGFQEASARLIVASHSRLLRRDLLPDGDADDLARRLYCAPFVVLAHDAAPDPVFFYANLAAQELFAMSWREIVRLPSRLSAEPLAREERQRLLDRGGVRIAASGERFRICGATVWNLIAGEATSVGQAATFANWLPLR